jgi:opacity protein-like surface antigen
MIVSWKALRKGVLVAAVVALLSSLMVASVSAQPPTPPNRFFGNATLDEKPAPAGTNVTATIGGNICGQTTVKNDSTYVLDVLSSGQTAGCGTEGASISFTVAGNAAGSGTWTSGKFTELDLAAKTPQPTAAPPTPKPVTPTPKAAAGSGGYLDDGSGTAWWAYMAAGLGLLLLGTAGAAAYRRLRP